MAKRGISKNAIRMDFDSALEEHLPDDVAEQDAMIAIAHAAWGRGDDIQIAIGDRMISGNQLVERCALKPFVDVVRACNERAKADGGFSPGDLAIGYGEIYRVLMRREITPLAMPRTDDYEVLLEKLNGAYFGFSAENEIERIADTSAEALAKLVEEEEIQLDEALYVYLRKHALHVAIDLLTKLAKVAIDHANANNLDTVVQIPKWPTAAQVVEVLNLKPFLCVERIQKGEDQ